MLPREPRVHFWFPAKSISFGNPLLHRDPTGAAPPALPLKWEDSWFMFFHKVFFREMIVLNG